MKQDDIAKIIKGHMLYLRNQGGGRGNLSSRELTGLKLAGLDLRSILAPGAHFGNCDLSNANLSDSDLFGAILERANCTNTNFQHADLRRVHAWRRRAQ